MSSLLIFGGTFDPIHKGHLHIAINVQTTFNFSHFYFLPCKTPLLKNHATATSAQRLTMLELALMDQPKSYHFALDDREIKRDSPSYMVTSLSDYRQNWGQDTAITLLLGWDAFHQFLQWYQWGKILSLANLLIIKRPSITIPSLAKPLQNLITNRATTNPLALLSQSHGLIHCFDAGDYPISSTAIRAQIEQKELTEVLPKAVSDYIINNRLYFKQHPS